VTYSKLLTEVADSLVQLLAPVAAMGVSVKHATDATLDSGARRTAECYVLVPSVSSNLDFSSATGLQTTGSGRAVVKAYLLCCGFELKAPKGVLWLLDKAEQAVSGCIVQINGCEVAVHCRGQQFTSAKDGFYQYRLELDVSVPYSLTTDWRRGDVH
jgi:hypothetical protein